MVDSDPVKRKHVCHKIAFSQTLQRSHTESSGHIIFARNLIIFCCNNKDINRKENKDNEFLVLGKGCSEVDDVQGEPELELKIKFSV